MTDTTFDFSETDEQGNHPVPAAFVLTLGHDDTDAALVADTSFLGGLGGTPPAPYALVLLAAVPTSSFVVATLTATWAQDGAIAFDWATLSDVGDPTDVFTFRVFGDGPDVAGFEQQGSSDWAPYSAQIPAGTYSVEFRFQRGDTNPPLPSALLANVVLSGATVVGVEPPAPVGYDRGKIVRHNGGLYLSLTENVLTEPGPGDSADWLELRVQTAP